MINDFRLKDLDKTAKYFLSLFLITLGIGISMGIYYVYLTTKTTPTGTVERFNGSESLENEIPEEFPKPLENMVLTTHNHINSFAMISFLIGFIFYFNSIINGKLKLFFMIEPLLSTLLTFSSLWIMRYVNEAFVYIVFLSSILLYICWFSMIFITIYELLFIKE
tara:strand:- start:1880 stop:2374 length:495 start_codon:yes stop_codon:yes gene_type:complete